MESTIWGPHYWFTLHTIATTYPDHPNDTIKKKYYNLFSDLPLFLPNKSMGNKFIDLLDKYPIMPYLSDKLSLMKWLHFIHNKINEQLGKKQISFQTSLEHYHQHYQPKTETKNESGLKKKHYWQVAVLIVLFSLIIYNK